MGQTSDMTGAESTEEFWSRPELVDAYLQEDTALPYEVDAIDTAVRLARRTGPVETVHVMGVGAGRELGAVRASSEATAVYAWDISAPMVRACGEHAHARGWFDVHVGQRAVADVRPTDTAAADVVVALGAVLGYDTTPESRRRTARALADLSRPGAGLAAVVQQRYGRPDWGFYFAVRSAAGLMTARSASIGNRHSRHGSASVAFHHFTSRELNSLLTDAGFVDVSVTSLRSWARATGASVPLRSPNPLIVTATAGPTTGRSAVHDSR